MLNNLSRKKKNSDSKKQIEKDNYPPLNFNGNKVQTAISQKHHLGLVSDCKLDFNEHISNKINKCNKMIGIMKKLSLFLSQKHFTNNL